MTANLQTLLVGTAFSFAAGVVGALLALSAAVLLNRRVRQKIRQFIRILGLVDAAKVAVFGSDTIKVSAANAQTANTSTDQTATSNTNVSLNWTVIRREDAAHPSSVKPLVSDGSTASQTAEGTFLARG